MSTDSADAPASTSPTPLILASGSRYRRELIERLGHPIVVCPSDVDESAMAGELPQHLVVRLAVDKANAVAELRAQEHPQGLIVGSDQLAVIAPLPEGKADAATPGDAEILGKPGTVAAACAQLRALSGRSVTFYTSLCVLRVSDGKRFEGLDTTTVAFRSLSDAEIAGYVAADKPLDCAGAFKSEGLGASLFQSIQTQDPNALVGLPMILLCRFLMDAGYPLLEPALASH